MATFKSESLQPTTVRKKRLSWQKAEGQALKMMQRTYASRIGIYSGT